MKVKLKKGTKFWHWGEFSIRKGEVKEAPDGILKYADGVLEEAVEAGTSKKGKKTEAKNEENNTE
ncbi:MAG: hypothetical protein KAS32_13980 [Candidatus Peribacteraceae bacterium]|nr:hypothetical protein [Candidatus Peribacteraceae bacterium]